MYAFEWKFYGSGVKVSSDKRIEVINLKEYEEIEVTDEPNLIERQSLAIETYKSRQKNWRAVPSLFRFKKLKNNNLD